MNIQDAVMGTDTPRDLLLAAGVQAFRLQAGYIAPVMTGEGVLPVTRFCHRDLRYAWVDGDEYHQFIGEMMVVYFDTRLCWKCCDGIQGLYYPTVRLYTLLDDGEICECCGNVKKDDIPF